MDLEVIGAVDDGIVVVGGSYDVFMANRPRAGNADGYGEDAAGVGIGAVDVAGVVTVLVVGGSCGVVLLGESCAVLGQPDVGLIDGEGCFGGEAVGGIDERGRA